MSLDKIQHQIDGGFIHLLGTGWTRIDMAMGATEIALITQVHLQRFQDAALDGREFSLQQQWACIKHLVFFFCGHIGGPLGFYSMTRSMQAHLSHQPRLRMNSSPR